MARRKEPKIPDAILDQLLGGADPKTAFDPNGLLDDLKKALAERALNAEMDHHLANGEAGNSRNGYGKKTVVTDTARIELDVPRDRQSTFDPHLIAKYQRRFPGFDEKIISITQEYGLSGLITTSENTLFTKKTYEYDPLEQLTLEGTKSHAFDSLGNPLNAEVNDLNQIFAKNNTQITYDTNGNPYQKTNPETTYTYDALNRLTKITTPAKTVEYIYDPFNRLYFKKTTQEKTKATHYYLYDREFEIGTCAKYEHHPRAKSPRTWSKRRHRGSHRNRAPIGSLHPTP